jgi:hypothetical protein
LQTHPGDKGVIRRADGVGEYRRCGEVEIVRDRCQVASGEYHILGISAGDVDADVPPKVLTYRLPAAKTPPASATHQVEAGGNPIAFGQTTDSRSEADNLTGYLVAEDVRERGGPFANAVSDREVESIDGASSNPQQDLPGPRLRDRNRTHLQRSSGFFDQNGSHGVW